MVDLERSTQLTSGPELRDVAANRSEYEPKPGLHYKATDTGAEFIGDGNRWNKIQSTGANPSFRSVDTGELHTTERGPTHTVVEKGGTLYTGGPSGSLYSGSSFGDALQSAINDATIGDRVHVQSPQSQTEYVWDKNVTWNAGCSLTSEYAPIKMGNGFNSYALTWEVPEPYGTSSHNISFRGFKIKGNAANRTSGGILDAGTAGYADHLHCVANHTEEFGTTGPIYYWGESGGFFSRNINIGCRSYALRMEGAWNYVIGNDLGPIYSFAAGTNWIIGNSIFGSKETEGARLSGHEIFLGNNVIDNYFHGVTIDNGASGNPPGLVQNNVIQNNSQDADNTYSGLRLSGSTAKNWRITDNIFYNRDTTLAGSGNGLQKTGILINTKMEDVVIKDNDASRNMQQAINPKNGTYTNSTVKDNVGYVTDNDGSASVSDTGTIAHGLVPTPSLKDVNVWTVSSNRAYATAVDGSNITIALEDPSGASVTTAETVYFQATVETL